METIAIIQTWKTFDEATFNSEQGNEAELSVGEEARFLPAACDAPDGELHLLAYLKC